jgi:hypothetical protein
MFVGSLVSLLGLVPFLDSLVACYIATLFDLAGFVVGLVVEGIFLFVSSAGLVVEPVVDLAFAPASDYNHISPDRVLGALPVHLSAILDTLYLNTVS